MSNPNHNSTLAASTATLPPTAITCTAIDLHLANLLLDAKLLEHYRQFILHAEKTLWNRRSVVALILKAIRRIHSTSNDCLTTSTIPDGNTDGDPFTFLNLSVSLIEQKNELLSAAASSAPQHQDQFETQWEERTTSLLRAASQLSQSLNTQHHHHKQAAEEKFRRWLDAENIEASVLPDTSILFNPNASTGSRLEKALQHQKALHEHPPLYHARPHLEPLFQNLEISRRPKFPTHIYTLDHGCLEGGLKIPTTTLITGITSTGKSQLLRHMLLLPVCHGQPTVYFSTEDSTDLIKKRTLSFLLKITNREMMRKTTAQLEQMLEKACEAWNAVNPEMGTRIYNNIRRKFFAVYLEQNNFRPEVMETYVHSVEDQLGEKLIYAGADYLQEGTPNGGLRHNEDNTRALRRWMTETKEVAIRNQLAFLIVAQSKGEQVGRATAAINHIVAESFSATWGVNYIFSIIRTAEETQRLTTSPDQRNRQEIIVVKTKDTGLGRTFALCDFATSTWIFFDTKEARDRAAGAAPVNNRDSYLPHLN